MNPPSSLLFQRPFLFGELFLRILCRNLYEPLKVPTLSVCSQKRAETCVEKTQSPEHLSGVHCPLTRTRRFGAALGSCFCSVPCEAVSCLAFFGNAALKALPVSLTCFKAVFKSSASKGKAGSGNRSPSSLSQRGRVTSCALMVCRQASDQDSNCVSNFFAASASFSSTDPSALAQIAAGCRGSYTLVSPEWCSDSTASCAWSDWKHPLCFGIHPRLPWANLLLRPKMQLLRLCACDCCLFSCELPSHAAAPCCRFFCIPLPN